MTITENTPDELIKQIESVCEELEYSFSLSPDRPFPMRRAAFRAADLLYVVVGYLSKLREGGITP
jgi:hypothetical protein